MTAALAALEESTPASAFFEATPILSDLRQFARSRLLQPWALLGTVLTRVLSEIDPSVCLPPVIGSRASLNLIVALVGPSGSGKSSASKAAVEFLGLTTDPDEAILKHLITAQSIGAGSGEGLTRAFLRWDKAEGKNVLVDEPKAYATIDEVGQIGELQSRSGNSFGSTLRSMLTGDEVHQTNAEDTRNRHLEANSYRLAGFIGVQPRLSGILLEDADAGTPQRVVWFPALDFEAEAGVQPPKSLRIWSPPSLSGDLRICSAAKHAITEAAVKRARGVDPLDGHKLLTQEKVAAALAFLHGDAAITEKWWGLAAIVMDVSAETRGTCIAELADAERLEDRKQGLRQARRKWTSDTEREERVMELATKLTIGVEKHWTEGAAWGARNGHASGEPCTISCLTRILRVERALAAEVLKYVSEDSMLEVIPDEKGIPTHLVPTSGTASFYQAANQPEHTAR